MYIFLYISNRATSAQWRFNSGAIGSLMHGVFLHEVKYEAELELWGDGYRIELLEPYSKVGFQATTNSAVL